MKRLVTLGFAVVLVLVFASPMFAQVAGELVSNTESGCITGSKTNWLTLKWVTPPVGEVVVCKPVKTNRQNGPR